MGSPQATTPNTLEASTPETLKRVVEIVANQLATSIDSVNPHSKFQDLGADSLDQVYMQIYANCFMEKDPNTNSKTMLSL